MPRCSSPCGCHPRGPSAVSFRLPRCSRKRVEDHPCIEQGKLASILSHLTLVTLVQIDLPAAQPERIIAQIESTFGLNPDEVLSISAKSGEGVQAVLEAIVKRIPPPAGDLDKPLKAFLFDSS
jgi:translation initiation factor 2 gamma subunit (eIF-2gamma)